MQQAVFHRVGMGRVHDEAVRQHLDGAVAMPQGLHPAGQVAGFDEVLTEAAGKRHVGAATHVAGLAQMARPAVNAQFGHVPAAFHERGLQPDALDAGIRVVPDLLGLHDVEEVAAFVGCKEGADLFLRLQRKVLAAEVDQHFPGLGACQQFTDAVQPGLHQAPGRPAHVARRGNEDIGVPTHHGLQGRLAAGQPLAVGHDQVDVVGVLDAVEHLGQLLGLLVGNDQIGKTHGRSPEWKGSGRRCRPAG